MGKAEAYVEKYLFAEVKKAGGLCFKFVSGVNGVPDRTVLLRGRSVFVETKAARGKPSALQLVRHREMRAVGADVRVISSREEVDALLVELLAT